MMRSSASWSDRNWTNSRLLLLHRIDLDQHSRQNLADSTRPFRDATSETGGAITVASTRPTGRHFRVEWHWWSSVQRISGPFLCAFET
jgi:hypothetical protein